MKVKSTLLAVCAAMTLLPGIVAAGERSAHGSGPYYGGGHHTASHGGHYAAGRGSSHKGGHYKNARTGDHYGHHK